MTQAWRAGPGWRAVPGADEAALRVARRAPGAPLTPAASAALVFLVRRGVVEAGPRVLDGRAPVAILQALARRGLVDLVEVDGVLAASPSEAFSVDCQAELEDQAKSAVTSAAEVVEAARAYLAALDEVHAPFESEAGRPLRGQALSRLRAARHASLRVAEQELRRRVRGWS